MYNLEKSTPIHTADKNLSYRAEEISSKSMDRTGWGLFFGGLFGAGVMAVAGPIITLYPQGYYSGNFIDTKEEFELVDQVHAFWNNTSLAFGLSLVGASFIVLPMADRKKNTENLEKDILAGKYLPVDDFTEELIGNYSVKQIKDFLNSMKKQKNIVKFKKEFYVLQENMGPFVNEVRKEALALRCEKGTGEGEYVGIDNLVEMGEFLEEFKVDTKRGTYIKKADFERILKHIANKYNMDFDDLKKLFEPKD